MQPNTLDSTDSLSEAESTLNVLTGGDEARSW
jgi:hypothetical protein